MPASVVDSNDPGTVQDRVDAVPGGWADTGEESPLGTLRLWLTTCTSELLTAVSSTPTHSTTASKTRRSGFRSRWGKAETNRTRSTSARATGSSTRSTLTAMTHLNSASTG